ncbi:hypothetical protein PINS_up015084 [Pythium insidiosum]|nr:hypothetical protein PINS_up015084 [Pythium insidiosum]
MPWMSVASGCCGNLESHQPTLYLEFPQGRLKMEGEVLFPKKNRFVTLQFPSNARSVVCQDVFDRVVTFPRVYWIGDALQNPEETPLPLPPEITIATAPFASMPWGPRIGVRPEEEDVAHDDMETTVASSKGKRTPRQRQKRGSVD